MAIISDIMAKAAFSWGPFPALYLCLLVVSGGRSPQFWGAQSVLMECRPAQCPRQEMPSPWRRLLPRDARFCGAECQEQETDAAQLLCLPGVGFASMWHLQKSIISISTGWEELWEYRGRLFWQISCVWLRCESPNWCVPWVLLTEMDWGWARAHGE